MSTVSPLLPIFPLDTVLLPGAPLPLHIFEQRYRTLIADVWDTRERGAEHAGFGIVAMRYHHGGGEVRRPGRHQRPAPHLAGSESGDLTADFARVGTFASIIEVEIAFGRALGPAHDRAPAVSLLELEDTGKPYLQARVDWLPEEQGSVSEALAQAARTRCERYLRELAELAGRELPRSASPMTRWPCRIR